ncbi:MAG: hypothetical protein QXL22_06125, partial [Candidatus Nezhaarchaeales archaeon]
VNTIKKRIVLSKRLDETTNKILEYIKEKGTVTPKEIIDEINKSGYKITKQKLSKILKKLLKMGYIDKIERGKYRYKP